MKTVRTGRRGELAQHFVEEPDENNFNVINFYTCKYFEGWDMFSDKARRGDQTIDIIKKDRRDLIKDQAAF